MDVQWYMDNKLNWSILIRKFIDLMSVGQNVSYFRSRPYKEVKGNHPRRHISKSRSIRSRSGNWNGLLAIEGKREQLRVARGNSCNPSTQKWLPSIELLNYLFLHKPAAMCFRFVLHASLFVRCPGHGNLQRCSPKLCLRGWLGKWENEWAEKIMDPMGVFWEFPPE